MPSTEPEDVGGRPRREDDVRQPDERQAGGEDDEEEGGGEHPGREPPGAVGMARRPGGGGTVEAQSLGGAAHGIPTHSAEPSPRCWCFQIGVRALSVSMTARQASKACPRCGAAAATTTARSPTSQGARAVDRGDPERLGGREDLLADGAHGLHGGGVRGVLEAGHRRRRGRGRGRPRRRGRHLRTRGGGRRRAPRRRTAARRARRRARPRRHRWPWSSSGIGRRNDSRAAVVG